MIVSFKDYEVTPRFDNLQWTLLRVNESPNSTGPWTQIDQQNLPAQDNPGDPQPISFTTDNATLTNGWYRIDFVDAGGQVVQTEPVYNSPPIEILATLDDINAHLSEEVVEATTQNTEKVQISVARIVRGYLARIIDTATLGTWSNPTATPEIVREAASLLIAAQVFFAETAKSTVVTENRHYAQILYDRGMAILNGIIDGSIVIEDVVIVVDDTNELTVEDFFPIDATDRAFTMGMEL